MVAPLIAAAAISAVSGLAQAYQAEQARGANAKRLRDLRKAFESIVPPEYDISIDDPPRYIETQLPAANLDFSRITPESYKLIGQYAPEAAEFVREQNPQLVQGSAAQKEGRQSQIDALREMQKVARGESPEMSIKLQQAADRAQAEAQSRQQSMLQDAQRRGMRGSGLTFGAQLQGAGDSMAQGAAASQAAAIAAYKDKLAAIQNAGQLGRQLSQDELSQERGNVDILNQFNERTSRNYQNYLSQRAAMQNQAQLQNLQMEQDIANRNTGAANEAQRYNLENRNRLAQQSYENTRGERNYQNQLAYDKANWAAQQKARANNLKTQAFQNAMAKQGAMSGLTGMMNQNESQSAADRNAMIGGLGQAGAGYFSGQAQRDAAAEAQNRADARMDKYLNARYGTRRDLSDNEDDYASNYV